MKKLMKVAAIAAIGFMANEAKAQKFETFVVHTSAVCDMCEETMQKELTFVPGVKSASLDLETFDLTVVYKKKKTSEKEIIAAINKCGYDADDSPADPKGYENLHSCCKKDAHKK